DHHLLHEIITPHLWTLDIHEACQQTHIDEHAIINNITYDTRAVHDGSLLFCKGAFKAEFLDSLTSDSICAYVAENDYSDHTQAIGFIVEDIRKAMSILSQAFYNYPAKELSIVGITGTKGKTTTAYFTHKLLQHSSNNRAALFSSINNCINGVDYVESDLTTPESLDAARMMRDAVEAGMKYLVMEVSSQSYKVDRVFGLHFNVGVFLNISPDHISPIEHPTFEDYFYCKRQLINNCDTFVVNKNCKHVNVIRQQAQLAQVPTVSFALAEQNTENTIVQNTLSKNTLYAKANDAQHHEFVIFDTKQNYGSLTLQHTPGDFNYENALAALQAVQCLGIAITPESLQSLRDVHVPGRMEIFTSRELNTIAIVDYAHNFASVSSLLDFVYQQYDAQNANITLVTGSAGDKAIDRREEIVQAAQNRIHSFMLTQEDSNHESTDAICVQMQQAITNPHVKSQIIHDRKVAIETVLQQNTQPSDTLHIVLIIGKGEERWIKEHGKHVPYEGDDQVVQRIFNSVQ
ncbi:MAG: UDP-N-acetylmuramoyl-L-alanyl-D-glutamate--2,6-diaminopimelate ligase, partial [Bifidobacteriaceae bacterium]|nr:UDP-N-acetylmuramoyl-L-alanyl-D-glutamate--2,6-diaminopimelate ligase [Bifidobacteriaceae bacterium]